MMNKTKVKAIAGVLVVFLLGAIIGALGTGLFIAHNFRRFMRGEPPLQKFFMRKLNREVDLTDEQKLEVQKVLEQTESEILQLLQKSHVEFKELMQQQNMRLKEVLTPEQQEKLDEVFKRMQSRWHPPPPLPHDAPYTPAN